MKKQRSYVVRGVIVDPLKRTQYGAEIFITNEKVEEIIPNANISEPYILPGFIDAHVHIESSMLVPSRFAEMAVKHGTVTVLTDPHEVANAAGESGIRFMIDNAKTVPLKFYFGLPSCVPASPLERSGAVITATDVEGLISEPDFHFLAEMMNFPGVINGDVEVLCKLKAASNANKPIDGHAPGLQGEQLERYIQAGITTDHECSTINEALNKISLGMKIQIREGSAAKNFDNLIPLISNHSNSIMFCTDDCHPDYLREGHINRLVSRAVNKGYDIFDVLKVACVNPTIHYNLQFNFIDKSISPDFTIVNNLQEFNVLSTYINGEEVYSKGKVNFDLPSVNPPQYNFRKTFNTGDLKVYAEGDKMNIIGAVEGELITDWIVEEISQNYGEEVSIDTKTDTLKIVLLDRYSESKPVVSFIRGFGLKNGALAASIAHDSHHIIAIGVDDNSIDQALKWIIQKRGGLCFAKGKQLNGIALPFYGLMTNDEGEEVSLRYKILNNLLENNGCTLKSPFMTASFMALTVIPNLKIFHKGLFDVLNFKETTLFPKS